MSYDLYAFDAYGTLFDVHAAVARHADAIGPDAQRLSDLWRAKQLEYTWVRSLAGAYRDFAQVTRDALLFAAARCGGLAPDLIERLLAAYETLDAYADARPALAALRASGAKVAILSNGSPAMLEAAVAAANLGDVLDAVISVDPLRLYKTAPEAYGLAVQRFGVAPARVSFQSSNRWDIAGAARFGFRPVWINRTGQPDEYADLPPAHVLRGLHELPSLDA
ncbi:MAG: haloacid dehalogenase [Hyphomicrobiales bacterium]|nr:haloacid dehalogenase [Hyphomicrobiales bacterium]